MTNQSLILSLVLLWLIVIPKVINGQGFFGGFSDGDFFDKEHDEDEDDDKKSNDDDDHIKLSEKFKSPMFEENEYSDKFEEENEKIEKKLDDEFKEPILHNNFILIIGDDMGIELLRMYRQDMLGQGRDNYPNTRVLDDLVANGVRFTQAHSYPVCSSTRATMLTGRYGFRSMLTYPIGTRLCREGLDYPQPTIPLSVPNARSAAFGKWHLSPETNGPSIQHVFDAGFERFDGLLAGQIVNGNPLGYVNWERCNNENPDCFEEPGYLTTVVTDAAIEWLEEVQREQFFIWMAHVAPHTPQHTPPLNLITNVPPVDCTLDLPPENAVLCAMAALEAMDTEIGRLLDSLDEDVRKKTTILFLGDNGTDGDFADSRPFDEETAKGTVFEGGIRIPFLISGNGVTAKGSTSKGLVTTADVYATVLDVMNGSPNLDVQFDSKSLLSHMKFPGYHHHDYIFSEIKGIPSRCIDTDLFEIVFDSSDAIIGDGYKLITFISYADNDEEVIEEERFYYLDDDPFERYDLLEGGEGNMNEYDLENLNNLREKRLELLNS